MWFARSQIVVGHLASPNVLTALVAIEHAGRKAVVGDRISPERVILDVRQWLDDVGDLDR